MKINFEEMKDFLVLYEKISKEDFPFMTAYKLNKLQKEIRKEFDFFENSFKELINKYAKRDENDEIVMSEDGESVLIQEDRLEECSKKLDELTSAEIDVEDIEFSAEDFINVQLKPSELKALIKFIK